jgi:hypothetical protein
MAAIMLSSITLEIAGNTSSYASECAGMIENLLCGMDQDYGKICCSDIEDYYS